MPHLYRFLALVVGLAAVAVSGPSFAQKAQGYVLEVSGNVTGQVGAGQPAKVEKGQTLVNNATVTTSPQSYAVLKFEDGTAVLLKENTSFQVQNYAYNPKVPENASAVFNLVRGGMRMLTGLVTSRNRDALKVATPLVTMGIRVLNSWRHWSTRYSSRCSAVRSPRPTPRERWFSVLARLAS